MAIGFFAREVVHREGMLGNAEEELGVSVWQGAETLPMMNPHRDPSLHKEPLRLYELHTAQITTNQPLCWEYKECRVPILYREMMPI